MTRWAAILGLMGLLGAVTSQAADCPHWGMDGAQGSDDSASSLELWENCVVFDTANTGRINLHGRIKAADTWTFRNAGTTTYVLELAPTVSVTAGSQTLAGLFAGGTYTATAAPGTGSVGGITTGAISLSATNAIKPWNLIGVAVQDILRGDDCGGGACALGTTVNFFGVHANLAAEVNGASTSLTVTNFTDFRSAPLFNANTAGSSLTITNRRGLHIVDPGVTATGTVVVTTNMGIHVAAQTVGTTVYGIRVAAQATGTNIFPMAFGEHTITGTVPAGELAIGAKGGAPNRFYAKNENQQVWEMGYTTWTGTGTALSTAVTTYWPINDRLVAVVGASETTIDVPAPGALTVTAMACAVDTAPGTSKSRVFSLREAAASVTPSCTISGTATSCTWCVASSGTPCTTTATTGEAVAAGAMLDLEATAVSTPAATDATCTLWWVLDAY